MILGIQAMNGNPLFLPDTPYAPYAPVAVAEGDEPLAVAEEEAEPVVV